MSSIGSHNAQTPPFTYGEPVRTLVMTGTGTALLSGTVEDVQPCDRGGWRVDVRIPSETGRDGHVLTRTYVDADGRSGRLLRGHERDAS